MRFLNHRVILLCVAALLSLVRPLAAGPGDTYDRWYVLRVQDQRAGWLHDRRSVEGDRITTSSDLRIELKRGEQALAVTVEASFVETLDGKPISMRLVRAYGTDPATEEYTFEKDGVAVVSTASGVKRSFRRDLPGGQWLTPAASSRFIRARLEAGAKEIIVRSIDPTSGLDPVLTTSTVIERTQIEAMGKIVPAIKWRSTTDTHPDATTIEFVDEFGVPIRSETSLGALKLEIVLADRELALSKVDAPELLLSTLVKPDRRIRSPRSVTSATYRLSLKDGKMPSIPSGSGQTVSHEADGSVRVTVNAAGAGGADDDQAVEAQSLPSAMVTSDDPELKRLVERALDGAGEGIAERAEAMRRFVHSYIRSKSLGVGFASAAEVARTRTGDCTEHAVLLAAMLRADGIPSRVVSGLIYADEFEGQKGVFGYHMWTQAREGERWLNLDATLPPGVKFDATHIALATSDLADGETSNALVSLVPLLGNLTIQVESTSQD